jgi:hypothetical protein
MAWKLSLPNLGGTFILLLVLAAILPSLTHVIDYMTPYLGDFSQFAATLIIPIVFLAVIANLWESEDNV